MAEIAHSFVSQPTRQEHTGDANFTDISGAAITSGNFTADDKYLIVVSAQADLSEIGDQHRIQTLHGSTAFAESELVWDNGNSAIGRNNYMWFTVWTAVTDEGIKLQYKTDTSTFTVGADTITLFSMNLSNDLTENTDWHFAEDATDHTVAASYGDADDASVTFTPGTASEDWLVLSYSRLAPGDSTTNWYGAIDRSGEATSTLPEASQEREASGDRMLPTTFRVFELGAASNTFKSQCRHDGAGEIANRVHNSIFALNLDKFDVQSNSYTEGSAALSVLTDFDTEISSVTFAPSGTGDVWSMGWWQFNTGLAGTYCKSRLQTDNSDSPPGQTSAAYEKEDSWDNNDLLPVGHQTLDNLDSSVHTVDMDASGEANSPGAEQRSVFAVTMELAAASSSQTTRDLQDTATFTDDLARDFWGDRLGADIRDVFTFSDSMVADLILIRELSDAVATFADQLNKDAIYIRTPQDSISFVDGLARDLINIRELQDTATFSDALVDLLHLLRELQDTLTFSDELARDQDLVRLLEDTKVLAENMTRTNTGDTDTIKDHHRFKLWQNLRRWRLYKPRDQIH